MIDWAHESAQRLTVAQPCLRVEFSRLSSGRAGPASGLSLRAITWHTDPRTRDPHLPVHPETSLMGTRLQRETPDPFQLMLVNAFIPMTFSATPDPSAREQSIPAALSNRRVETAFSRVFAAPVTLPIRAPSRRSSSA